MLSGLGRGRREEKSPRQGAVGFFFFDACALMEAPVLRKTELAEATCTVPLRNAQVKTVANCRVSAWPGGLPLCLTQEYRVTTRVGRYAHLAYLLARSKNDIV